ncbi:MAG TPA: Uma2 family endonuclease [Aggregatilineales bacterium]|nr:Uma2 family endonuclease [Aggregatilineales bacterium]
MLERVADGHIIAQDVTFEDYLRLYAEDHCEWVDGAVIKMSPISREHDNLDGFLYRLISGYLDETGEAVIRRAPFVMRMRPDSRGREPDMHIVLKSRASILKNTITTGPADIVIEIVSEESEYRDYEIKYSEYESGGVSEYWLLDPLQRASRFLHLVNGVYQPVPLVDGVFHSTVLKPFTLDPALLWRDPLPKAREIAALIETMLA